MGTVVKFSFVNYESGNLSHTFGSMAIYSQKTCFVHIKGKKHRRRDLPKLSVWHATQNF